MIKAFLTLFLCLFLCACGTKRQYYKPEKVVGKISYDERNKSKITNTNLNFAKLKNSQSLSKEGIIENFKLEKGYTLLKIEDGEFVIADDNGNLKIVDENAQESYSHKFDAAVLGVDLRGDDLALILANNTIVVANKSLGIKMSQTLSEANGQDSRIPAPIFLDTLIVFASLDGRLIFVDSTSLKIHKDIIVSSENFFNNIIYLNIINDRLIAATAKKVLIYTPNSTYSFDAEIKNVNVHENFIYILTKDGNIIKTDSNLKKITEKKLKFAIFNKSQIYDNALYVFEKTGYLIKSDLNLENMQVYRFKNAVNEKSFMGEDKFYYSNKILNLK
ncbi:hypothetical protein DMB92_03830 [Campylobacter sp. MIT 99-7217]|uniref:hypothetical protein n=1 Tax=Campylobacter sp. MIT 99-7217 TaxID=535091 RepID=UPI001156CF93|nr:hypothetical protein [Campylobacter sp. MIT 99-7217]TQR33097.1 hypothetical protein DMB92_03830 [Campylobacter sp. MIT 99-7217]